MAPHDESVCQAVLDEALCSWVETDAEVVYRKLRASWNDASAVGVSCDLYPLRERERCVGLFLQQLWQSAGPHML